MPYLRSLCCLLALSVDSCRVSPNMSRYCYHRQRASDYPQFDSSRVDASAVRSRSPLITSETTRTHLLYESRHSEQRQHTFFDICDYNIQKFSYSSSRATDRTDLSNRRFMSIDNNDKLYSFISTEHVCPLFSILYMQSRRSHKRYYEQ